ncbi:MAG TPA: pyridoxal-dependent decarboxylase [Methylomirabilota bacterium]|nr:pyridoxal-dependent decarboxylase [Methylomirabilota bacterium]
MTTSTGKTVPPALDPEHFRRLAHDAVDLVADYLAALGTGPVFRPMSVEQRSTLIQEALAPSGVRPEALIERFRTAVLPHAMGNGHPRFFGWVNSPPAPIGIVADFLAAALNPSCAGGDHAAIYVERAAVRWLMELIGFPTGDSMGLLVSGGSAATLVALAAARHRAAREDGWNVRAEGLQHARPALCLYATADSHSCIQKAAEILGLGAESIRRVASDERHRMDVESLRAAVAADRAAGRRPFCVAASAGTVGTGAIDPLDSIADLCAAERLWLHVDGAYGAVGAALPSLSARYAGLERADSIALDPHKWLSVPVECGAVLVRDGRLLRESFSLVPDYLRTEADRGFGGLPWYSEYGIQQTRGFRALKLWMVLQHLGRDGVRELIGRHLALARHLAALVDAAPDLERLAEVELSIVCFRYAPARLRGDERALDALNKRVMEDVQASGAAFLTQTTLGGRFALRACVLHYATADSDVTALVDAVRGTGARLTAI